MQGIVKQVQSNGSVNLKHGTFYKYEVSIQSDNELLHGEYLSKSDNQNKFVQGEEVNFEFTGGKYPKIKPVTDFEYKSSFSNEPQAPTTDKNNISPYSRETLIIRQSTLKCATDYICNNGGDKADVVELAEMFTEYVLTGKKPTKENNNDMPF